jgi:hypothetical protein
VTILWTMRSVTRETAMKDHLSPVASLKSDWMMTLARPYLAQTCHSRKIPISLVGFPATDPPQVAPPRKLGDLGDPGGLKSAPPADVPVHRGGMRAMRR